MVTMVNSENNHFNNLAKMLEIGNYEEVITVSHGLIEKQPTNSNFFLYLCLAYLLHGREEEAEEVWLSLCLNKNEAQVENLLLDLSKIVENLASRKLEQTISQASFLAVKRLYELVLNLDLRDTQTFLANRIEATIKKYLEEVLSLVLKCRFTEAQALLEAILTLQPTNAYAWHNLAMIYYEQENYLDAYHTLLKSLDCDENIALHHYSLGIILEKLNQWDVAKIAYHKTIEMDDTIVDAFNNLGVLETKTDNLAQAEIVYRQLISNHPSYLGGYINLANLLVEKAAYTEAIQLYEKALSLKPRDPNVLHNMAIAYEQSGNREQATLYQAYSVYRLGDYPQAIQLFNEFINNNQANGYAYLCLGECYKKIGNLEQTIEIYKTGIQYNPKYAVLHRFLFYTFHQLGLIEQAQKTLLDAIEKADNKLAFQQLEKSLLPLVYKDEEEINYYRQRFTDFSEQLTQSLKLETEQDINDAIESISLRTNFLLHYQGLNDLELQQQTGNYIRKILEAKYPQWCQKLPLPTVREKIRIGYVSEKFQRKLGELFLGWLKYADRERFEIFCYDVDSFLNFENVDARIYSDYYYHFYDNVEAICEQIRQNNLHILVFLDIGMNEIMTRLGSLNLAPIQCLAWGHPVTSGLPAIDYFLSSQAMESPHAHLHYSETVVNLPKLGIVYPKLQIEDNFVLKSRSELKFKDTDILYVMCQYLPKYLPQHDYLMVKIVQQVPNAKFVFFAREDTHNINHHFLPRLQSHFSRANINLEDCLYLITDGDFNHYVNILLQSDVFLDTIGWSGGITTLDALSLNLPIVTLPGEFLRGRQSYGMLNIMGVTETIATSEQDYLNIAVRLGQNPQWRRSIKAEMKANEDKLFNDLDCVKALEDFYEQAILNYPCKI